MAGVWSDRQLRASIGSILRAERPIEPNQIQPASLDLRLSARAYRAPASFLAGKGRSVAERIAALDLAPVDLEAGAVLPRGSIHVARLEERLDLPNAVAAIANPKSSTGRIDVFVRLITDEGEAFDRVKPGYHGPLWAEISPRSYHVRVRRGSRLLQLRLIEGRAETRPEAAAAMEGAGEIEDGAMGLRVDLGADGPPEEIVGFEALRGIELAIDVDRRQSSDPREFWRPIRAFDAAKGLVLRPDDFYILLSAETVSIPPDLAAEMIAYDTSVGEFRVHYAGFFDPGFGWPGEESAARAVLEVRSHEVPFLLEHRQRIGRLAFKRMQERPETLYGRGEGSNYQGQSLALAKHFRPWR